MCCAVDRELRIVYVNRRLQELIQQPRHRLMGKAIAGGLLPCGTRSRRDLNPSPKRSARGSKVTFIKAIRDIPSIFSFPIRLRQVDGRTFLIRSDVGGRLCRHFAGWAGV